MTVCIAAVTAEQHPKIVLCADDKGSSSLGTTQMLKIRPVGPANFQCLVSGAEPEIVAVTSLLRQSLARVPTIDETNLLPLVRDALVRRKLDKVEELVRGRLAMSYEDFLKTGKARLPDDLFTSTFLDVERTVVEADFIVCGIDQYGLTYIAQSSADCRVVFTEDFATIGEGAYLAQASLLNRRGWRESLEHTLYSVYEAKRFAEGAPSVGPATTMRVMHPDGRVDMVSKRGLVQLEELYKEFGRQELVPSSIDMGTIHYPTSAAASAE